MSSSVQRIFGPYRKVVKMEADFRSECHSSNGWRVSLTLDCGHTVKRPWPRKPQLWARCHWCQIKKDSKDNNADPS